MVRRVFRAFLFGGVTLALWALALPARAATLSPFCDDRGASAVAADPSLEAPDLAVRRVAVSCDGLDADESVLAVVPGHPRAPAPAAIAEPAVAVTAPRIPPADSAPLDFVHDTTPPRSGVHDRVERPPRG